MTTSGDQAVEKESMEKGGKASGSVVAIAKVPRTYGNPRKLRWMIIE